MRWKGPVSPKFSTKHWRTSPHSFTRILCHDLDTVVNGEYIGTDNYGRDPQTRGAFGRLCSTYKRGVWAWVQNTRYFAQAAHSCSLLLFIMGCEAYNHLSTVALWRWRSQSYAARQENVNHQQQLGNYPAAYVGLIAFCLMGCTHRARY